MATKCKCPICGRPSDFNVPPIGTFCSERCKLIDLGKWLGQEYTASEPLRPDHFAEYEGLEGGSELDHPERY
jgi:endogenous inhibitor of DNA gyrase (YacG/DUF329 family)